MYLVGKKNKGIQKFIIFASQRTGSTLLVSSLNSHPEIRCHSELLNPKEPQVNFKKWGRFHRQINRVLRRLYHVIRNTIPKIFLNKIICYQIDKSIDWLGFKLFVDHMENKKYKQALTRYLESTDHYIYLYRANKLAVLYSYIRATETKQWSSRNHTSINNNNYDSFSIPIEVCQKYFARYEREEQTIKRYLSGKSHLIVEYKELVQNYDHTMQRIQEYLRVTPEVLSSRHEKLRTRPLHELIANYDELKEAFGDSKWSIFFKHQPT